MNPRIMELARRVVGKNRNDVGSISLFDEQIEKFAELIVRECIFKIENEAAQYAEPVWSFELVNDIKEHFGVEEDEAFNCPMCGLQNPTTSCGLPNCGLIT